MKEKNLLIASALLAVTGLISGCATGGPGKVASDTPPMIVTDKDNHNIWNDPGLFGPVPANLAATGNADCKAAGFEKGAIGYHPHAKNVHGNEIPGGGYLCAN